VAEVLLAHGADPNGAKRGSNGAPADRQVTPLCIAAQEGHADMVRVLLAGGAEPDRARGDGVVPLYIAVQNGHHAAVRALLAAGASARSCAVGGFSALYLASQEGDTEMVRELARAGAAVDERQPDGLVPLAAAVRNGHREAEAALMQAGADPALAWCSWEDRLRSPLRAAAARLGALVSLLTT
jgi:ankyrin repeat protein